MGDSNTQGIFFSLTSNIILLASYIFPLTSYLLHLPSHLSLLHHQILHVLLGAFAFEIELDVVKNIAYLLEWRFCVEVGILLGE